MSINCFSKEVASELGYYVYRLLDPRDGSTFYVGKGTGNRVFAHVNQALESYQGESFFTKDEDLTSLKISTINQIKDAGLEVIHIIQRYGLTSDEAFAVESVLIDLYSLENLTNEVHGHSYDLGPSNALTLENDLVKVEYVDTEEMPDYMIIKVNSYWLQYNNNDRYQTTKEWWRNSINTVKKYKYVLSVTNSIVREVYEVFDDGWYKHEEWNRVGFNGKVASKEIRDLFIDKKIPEKYRKRGMASPVVFKKK